MPYSTLKPCRHKISPCTSRVPASSRLERVGRLSQLQGHLGKAQTGGQFVEQKENQDTTGGRGPLID